MNSEISGIHHITAIAGDPQANIDFYTEVMGLRLIKRTVNFDDPGTWHLYYGNGSGDPGTVLTFFPWGARGWRGWTGTGQLSVISFSITEEAMGYWVERLHRCGISIQGPYSRSEEEILRLRDPDRINLELVATAAEQRPGWLDGPVPPEMAIRGFYGATLALTTCDETVVFLTESLGFNLLEESDSRLRFGAASGKPGGILDLLCLPNEQRGRMGVGAVHHIAWRVPGNREQGAYRDKLIQLEHTVTPVIDRKYFRSIYFREPGNVLFEIATDGPGFLIDESQEALGGRLQLPPWYEARREELEAALPEINVPNTVKI